MLNFRKKFFLFLTILVSVVCLASCTDATNTVRINFEKDEYTVRMHSDPLTIKPIIEHSASISDSEIEVVYESSDESIARYVQGILYPVNEGEVTIKAYYKDKETVFDKATVKVLKAALPTFEYETQTMLVGDTKPLVYDLSYNYTNAVAEFTALTPEIAEIDAEGKVTAHEVGTARFSVVVKDDEEASEPIEITVEVIKADYVINYELDGGTNDPENPAGYNAFEILDTPLKLNPATKKGYEFVTWMMDGKEVTEIPAGHVGDVTLTAVFEIVEYTITYDEAGGVNDESNPTKYTIEDEDFTLLPATREHYNFKGWQNAEGEIVTEIKKGETTGNLELTATWEAITYELDLDYAGGMFVETLDVSNAEVMEEFHINYFLAYDVNGNAACINDNVSFGRWWSFIALKEIETSGIYEIVQVGAGSPAITEDFDLVISWHDALTDATLKATLDKIVNASATYVGQYVVLENVPADKSSDCDITVKVVKADTVTETKPAPKTYTFDDEIILPSATKEGYKFLGWFDGEDKVEKIAKGSTGDKHLVAHWEVIEYTLELDPADGELDYTPYVANEEVMEEFHINYFKKYDVNGNAACINDNVSFGRWWSFIALKEIETSGIYEIVQVGAGSPAITEDFDLVISWHDALTDATLKATLDKILNASATYVGQCVVLENVPASESSECDVTVKVITAESVVRPEEAPATYTVEKEIVLPKATKAGHVFLGWFDGDTKVEKIAKGTTGNKHLVAHWEQVVVKHKVEFFLNDGTCDDLPSEYVEGQVLELPTPTKPNAHFVGWYDNEECQGDIKTEIPATATEDLKFWAKWEEDEEPKPAETFEIEYHLNGGSWPVESIDSWEEMAEAFAKAWGEFYKVEITPATFMDVSYSADPDNFFKDPANSDWAWVYTYLVQYLQTTGNKFATNIAGENEDSHDAILRSNIHGFLNHSQRSEWPASADFTSVEFNDLTQYLPAGKEVSGPLTYTNDVDTELVEPVWEGHSFLGWFNGDHKVDKIEKGTTGKLTLEAKWREGDVKDLTVGEGQAYQTLAEALAEAVEGDVIVVVAGTYEGTEITVNGVTIKGPNATISAVDGERQDEAVFTTDLIIAANDVTIDGIKLTGDARIAGAQTGTKNATVKCVLIDGSTLNKTSSDNANAPFNFSVSSPDYTHENVKISDCANINSTEGRGMIFYGNGIVNLTIENSKFVGKRANYNDGIKLDKGSSDFAVKGEVNIIGNHIENYAQYTIWFNHYGEGTYNVQNNTFVNNGTEQYNADIYFANYVGTTDGTVTGNFLYNTHRGTFRAVRLNKADGRTKDNFVIKANYNKIYASKAAHFLHNENTFDVDGTNNYYDVAVSADKFLGFVYEPYYENENQVPVYGQPLNFFDIDYELGTGYFDDTYPQSFDSTTGLSSLPTPKDDTLIFVGWMMDGEMVTEIPAGTDHSVTLEAVWREDAIYVSKNGEDYAVETLAEAIAQAKDGDKIIVLAGEYEESITIDVPNLVLAGANQGINPNTLERGDEAIIKGIITLTNKANNVVIDGLSFTEGSKVQQAEGTSTINGFTFQNNIVTDIAQTSSWILNRYVSKGFLQFSVSGNSIKNFEIYDNKFENVGDINVLLGCVENLTIDGNSFKDFGSDAIRVEGGHDYGYLSFTNNHFEQTTVGHGNNAIFTYATAGVSGTTTKVTVKGNTFVRIGSNDASTAPYNGTISNHVYQENTISWDITDNVFDHCLNIMWLRNNGADAEIYTCNVENNKFLGIPETYYFGTYQGDDTESSNPHLAVFGENYYEDNEGNPITDLTPYADKFNHLKTYGTAASEEIETSSAERFEFYSITYDLGGGKATGLVTSYHKESGVITLPTPTWDAYHEFAGWTLDGTDIEEIPAGKVGNLHIVAHWTEIEGDPVQLEFDLDGGNWMYESFNDICLDLLNDYNIYSGNTYTQESLKSAMGAWSGINVADFYYSEGMAEKWAWLATWLGQVGGSANKAACTALTTSQNLADFKKKNSNYIYAVTYEFRAFMVGGTDYSNGNYKSSDYSNTELRLQIWDAYASEITTTLDTTVGKQITLPTPKKEYLSFGGWYTTPDCDGSPVDANYTVLEENPKFYAKWVDLNPVTGVEIKNAITRTKRFTSLDLEWEVLPAETKNKTVLFTSDDESIATVNAEGHIEFLKAGTVTIKVASAADDRKYAEMTVEVYVPEHIQGSFETTSYVTVSSTIQLNAELISGEGTILWKSLDEEIASVEGGVVTGLQEGTARIVAYKEGDEDTKLEFSVIVVNDIAEGIEEFVMSQNNANIFLRSQLGIGAGNYAYYTDILSSVNKLAFEEYTVNRKYYTDSPTLNNHSGVRQYDLEFITVHYTGNMATGSTASANANYFVNQSTGSSIHYVTGNDGIFYCYDEKFITWHAGDGTGNPLDWYPTGVKVKEGDPDRPVVTITENSKFAINGTETTVSCPQGYARVWDGGKMVDGDWIVPRDSKYLTDLGPAVKVVDGEYYIGETWWCNSQVAEGRVCSLGGNLQSIGIETACNEGSDLWLTWMRTSQLVADLLIRYDLGIDRVKGHNFYAAKDCPQPMLENDDEIWWEFIDLVKAQYEAMTTYEGWTIRCVSDNPEIVDNLGRVINQPEYDTCVTYTVTCTKGEDVKTIKLSSMVPGMYRNLAKGER